MRHHVLDAIGEENKRNANKERQRKTCNPENFNDPLALKVNWEAKKYKSSQSGASRLKRNSRNSDRVTFSISNIAVIFCFIFMLVGLGAVVVALWLFMNKDFDIFPVVVLCFLGLCFFSPGFLILIFNLKTKVFDKNIGYFWEGRVLQSTSKAIAFLLMKFMQFNCLKTPIFVRMIRSLVSLISK